MQLDLLKTKLSIRFFLFSCSLIYFVLSIFFIVYGSLTLEEGAYLYAGQLVYSGKVLYRDFQYGQTSLWPYIYGLPQKIFGTSLYLGRLTSLFFGLLTLFLAIKLANKLKGKWAGLLTGLLIISNSLTIHYFNKSLTYTLTSFFLILSAYFLVSQLKEPFKISLSVVAMSAGLACRIILLPALILLLIYIIWQYGKRKINIFVAFISALISQVVFFGPFYWLDKENFLFHLLGSQLERTDTMVYYKILPAFYWFHRRLEYFQNSLVHYFALIVLLTIIVIYVLIKIKQPREIKEIVSNSRYSLFLLFLAIVLVIPLVSSLSNPAFVHYHTLVVPLAALVVSFGWLEIGQKLKSKQGRYLLLTFLVTIILVGLFIQSRGVAIGQPVIKTVSEAANLLKNYTQPGDEILTFSAVVAIEAQRELPHGLERGIYTYHPQDSLAKCRKYNLFSTEDLLGYINSRKAKAVLLTDRYFYGYHLDPIPETRALIEETIKKNYSLVKEIPNFGGWAGQAYLYLPREK